MRTPSTEVQGSVKPKRSFFGKLWRGAVRAVIISIPSVSQIVEFFGIDLNDYIYRGIEIGGVDYDGNASLSDAESAVIESWFTNSFAPKYSDLLIKANKIYNTTNLKLQVVLLNELNIELAVLKEYLNWDNPKLSSLAISQRNDLASELIGQIEHLTFKTIDESPVVFNPLKVEVESTPAMLFPIITLQKFKAVATNYTILESEEDLTPVNDEPTETKEENKKANALPWWAYLIGGAVVYKIFK